MDRRKKHIDYDKLIKSLHSEKGGASDSAPVPINDEEKSHIKQEVCLATRKRASKLSDSLNGYAYSKQESIIHDRTCWRASKIKDEDFEMSRTLLPEKELCPSCKRKAMIRLGLGDDGKYIEAYNKFFRAAYVSNNQLHNLFVEHHVKVKILDITHMELDVSGEKWILERVGKRVRIYHNNYILSDAGTRIMRKEYHPQTEKPIPTAYAIERILSYSWEDAHASKGKKQEETAKIAGLSSEKITKSCCEGGTDTLTRKVSVTELRRHFERYLNMVIAGDVLIITRYGKEIAVIEPFRGEKACADDPWAGLRPHLGMVDEDISFDRNQPLLSEFPEKDPLDWLDPESVSNTANSLAEWNRLSKKRRTNVLRYLFSLQLKVWYTSFFAPTYGRVHRFFHSHLR